MSNSETPLVYESLRENPDEVIPVKTTEVRCSACRGSGTVMVGGWESDCIPCEGYGTVLVNQLVV